MTPVAPVPRRVVTSRRGGASRPPYDSFNLAGGTGDDPVAVAANRRRLATAIGVPPSSVSWMSQVHGDRIEVVDRPRRAAIPDTDALVTGTRGIALVVLVADCVPVLLADAAAGVVAVAHAGRVGASAGIGERVVDAMVDRGASVGGIDVLLGPAICGGCYEVPAEMAADVDARLPGSRCRTADGTPGLDIRAGLARQLTDRGVRQVTADPRCTAEDPDLFSYRRDGVTGRQAGVAWLS